jgi:uncharacterized protein (TIGR02145 family)
MSHREAMPCIFFRTVQVSRGHLPFLPSVLEQIPLNSQNSAEFAVEILDVPFKCIQICDITYLKNNKMTPRNLRLIFDPLFRFAEANVKLAPPENGEQSKVLTLPPQNLLKKSMLLLVALFIFTSVTLMAQSPQKINFQSIVRNTNGLIVSNKTLSIKISLLSDSITGTQVYSESHAIKTDAIGLVSLQIGSGTALSGSFANINWGNAAHFIKLEADFTGGTTYELLGAQELMSVPYALYAVKTDTSVLNLTGRLSGKVNVTDTSSMLAPYLRRVDANASVETDPVFNSSIAQGITGTDTAYWNKKLNTADTSAMLSNYRTALALKAPLASPTFTGTVSGIDKAMVGLGDVNNTTDLNKPVSTLTQTALALKAPLANPTFTGTVGGIDKTMVGLGNVDNTTDINKPISTATQAALTDKAPINSPTFTGTVGGIDKTMVGLSNVDNTTDVNKPVSTATQTALNLKVNVSDTSNMLNPYLRKADAIISNAIAIIADLQNQVTVLQNRIDVNNLFTGANAVDIDGNNYQGVRIGGQIWMSENLKTSRYNNGDLIPIVTDNAAWSALTTGSRSWYDNDGTTYENPYGNLYNWYAVNDPRKLCPTGWHVPTHDEWTILTTYLEGESVAGGKMKSTGTDYWLEESAGTDNSSGFSALPGGNRSDFDGSFFFIRIIAFFWSATEFDDSHAWTRNLYFDNGIVTRNNLNYGKSVGASVRCLRD